MKKSLINLIDTENITQHVKGVYKSRQGLDEDHTTSTSLMNCTSRDQRNIINYKSFD